MIAGHMTAGHMTAGELAMRTEGPMVDPVYTAKEAGR
jgi:hypothetical protein